MSEPAPGPAADPAPQLVLASGSQVRCRLLTAAGFSFKTQPADLDETAIIEREGALGRSSGAIAGILADQKALAVAQEAGPLSLVIGSDQILDLDGEIFQKPQSLEDVSVRIKRLQGTTHTLFCAVSLAQAGAIVWRHMERADLTLHALDDVAIAAYVERHGQDVMGSVGAYHLEEAGVNLFSHIDGDYFSILGLPLVPLTARLRRLGVTPL